MKPTPPGYRWPVISVITPSFNQVAFLSKSMRSVLDPQYPALEYLVLDGGSTDGSKQIIQSHQSHLAFWVSENDGGQSAAINRGFRQSTGEILCWLNSDDFFEPDTLFYVGQYFLEHPETDAICGHVRTVDAEGNLLPTQHGEYRGRRALAAFWEGYSMHQPAIFWRRRVYEAIGGLDERLHLSMDFDYWMRMADRCRIEAVDQVLATASIHPAQKTAGGFGHYRRAQLYDLLRHFAVPGRLRDWPISAGLYEHLLKTAWRLLAGKPTIYS